MMNEVSKNLNDDVHFLTVDEFAKKIGVHPQTVRLWDKSGILVPHHRTPSGRRQYSEDQIKEYFENNR